MGILTEDSSEGLINIVKSKLNSKINSKLNGTRISAQNYEE